MSTSDSNIIIKFADNIVGLISHNKEEAYRKEGIHLESWCRENNLLMNTSKTKELIVNYKRSSRVTSVHSALAGLRWRGWTVLHTSV